MHDSSSLNRRLLLTRVMKLLVIVGFLGLLIPFFSSLSSNINDEKGDTTIHWVASLPIKAIVPGEVKTLLWSGGIFWVYKRTEKDIALLKKSKLFLIDSSSESSDQPKDMMNEFRSAEKSLFVFIPFENKRGCQVRLYDAEGGIRFTEPCYAAKYDAAGRLFNNSGHVDQRNLSVPKHIIEKGILKIGVWVRK